MRVCFASRYSRVRISLEFPTNVVLSNEVSAIQKDSLRSREFFDARNKSAGGNRNLNKRLPHRRRVFCVRACVCSVFRVYACVSVSLACTRPEESAQNWPKQKDGTRVCVCSAESVYRRWCTRARVSAR